MASRITVAEILARNAERIERERVTRGDFSNDFVDFDDSAVDLSDRAPFDSPVPVESRSLSLFTAGTVEPESLDASAAMRANATILVDKLRFARTVFEQYEGRRDFARVLGYKKNLDFDQYFDQYDRGDVAQRIVDIPAEETWFGFPEVIDSDGRRGEFARSWKQLSARLNLPEVFCRLDRASGIGHFGCALVGLRGQDDLSQPIRPIGAPEDVLYVSVFSEGSIKLGETETDPSEELYGKPKEYFLDFGDRAAATSQTGTGVHSSRIIHFAEGRLESDLYGIPRLKPVFNRLFDMAKVIGGSAETFWQVANKGLHANIDPTKARGLKQSSLDKLAKDMEDYRDQITRVLRTYGVDIQDLGSDVVNPRGVFAVIAAVIAGASKIPIRMLYPETRGAATSTNDRVAFREEIVLPRQKRVAEPQVVRPFVRMMTFIGAMPEPKQDENSDFIDFDVIWPDPVSRSKVDQVEIALKRSTAVLNMAKARQAYAQSLVTAHLPPLLTPKQEAEVLGLDDEPEANTPAPPSTPAPPATPDVTDPTQTPPSATPPKPATPATPPKPKPATPPSSGA